MIYYPIQTLVDAGIKEILVVTGGRSSGDFLRLLANGREFGLKHRGVRDAALAFPIGVVQYRDAF
jgi:dTDP-glucose pyrophosphorylase